MGVALKSSSIITLTTPIIKSMVKVFNRYLLIALLAFLIVLTGCYAPKDDDLGPEDFLPDNVEISFALDGKLYKEIKALNGQDRFGYEIFDTGSFDEAGLSAEGVFNNQHNYRLDIYWPIETLGSFQISGPINRIAHLFTAFYCPFVLLRYHLEIQLSFSIMKLKRLT